MGINIETCKILLGLDENLLLKKKEEIKKYNDYLENKEWLIYESVSEKFKYKKLLVVNVCKLKN